MDGLIRNPLGNPSSMRKAYGEALVDLGHARQDVVVLSADVQSSDFSYMFEAAFPERFINVGIAEPALVDVAVGLATSGKVPIANTFAFLFATLSTSRRKAGASAYTGNARNRAASRVFRDVWSDRGNVTDLLLASGSTERKAWECRAASRQYTGPDRRRERKRSGGR